MIFGSPSLKAAVQTFATKSALRKPSIATSTRLDNERSKLYSYLDVCISMDQVGRAAEIIKHYEKCPKARDTLETGHYNMLIKGWSKLGSRDLMIDTRAHMIQRGIMPDLQTYAYILCSYTRSTISSGRIKAFLKDMRSRDLEPEKLFQAAFFSASDRKDMLALIRKVEPNFADSFLPVPIERNCNLLDNLELQPHEKRDLSLKASKLEQWLDLQRTTEWKSSTTIKSVARARVSNMERKYETVWKRLLDIWKSSLTQALNEGLETLRVQADAMNKIHLYPYIGMLDKRELVNLMLDEIEISSTHSSFSLPTSFLHLDLGKRVYGKYLRMQAIRDGSHAERINLYNHYLTNYVANPQVLGTISSREFMQKKAMEDRCYGLYKDFIGHQGDWPMNILAAIGRYLYGLILREAKFDPELLRHPERSPKSENLVHAFYTAYTQIGNTHKNKEEFRSHKDIEHVCARACNIRLKFSYNFLPMCTPPMPWISHQVGGYLTSKSELVRQNHGFEGTSCNDFDKNHKLYPSFDSLNALALCPWIVNKEVLDLAIELFRSGGDYNLAIPFSESKMEKEAPVLKGNPTKADKIIYMKAKSKHDQKKREMYSLWSDCHYRLSIANHFRDRIFWLPHNMDFRGRTYAIPPHFNHLGADLARSILLFAEGKELGERGLDWLKIHLINLGGTMKSFTLQERLDYANSILDLEILDSAESPWSGRRWWTKNENPWQVLACCMEIAKATKSADPTRYICHLAVHQDGSCNGLQHYAALGRDESGATAVNLVPSERPQDVYSRVVDIVEAKRLKDAQEGNNLAKGLEGFIKRKVIKQTVMTTVYGVTRYGARNQIARQLAAFNLPDQLIWPSANYLAGKTFDSIKQVFTASRSIQDWLNECATVIASRFLRPVSWETPLGFTVVQPYAGGRSGSTKFLSAGFADATPVQITNDPNSLNINTSKQRTAFPPNYIHSLDSTHMMMTSLYCQKMGLTFVSVHDCYWTHPSTVDQMNRVCREQFVALHQEPLLWILSQQFLTRYAAHIKQDSETRRAKESRLSRSKATTSKRSPPDSEDVFGDRMVEDDLRELISEVEEDEEREEEEDSSIADGESLEQTQGEPSPAAPRQIHDLNRVHSSSLVKALTKSTAISKERARLTFTRVPEQGDLDLRVILKSTYFFS